MNSNIDFSDFSKIKVENKSKCRKITKITKYKFALFSSFMVLIIIVLIVSLIYNNNQYSKKSKQLLRIKNNINEINSEILTIENKTIEAESNLILLINELSINKIELDKRKNEYTNIENIIDNLKYNKNELLAKKEYLINQITYKQKCLKEDELKLEIQEKQNILNQIKQRFEDLTIKNSNILIDYEYFETFTNTEIIKKCYDSKVYGFHVNRFHDNCDGYPLLILIKTKNGKNIGAFTSMTNEGIKKIVDEKSILINFDKNKYFLYNKNENNNNCYVYSDIDQFPIFGNDLIIYRDGHGESKFPECYNMNGQSDKGDFIEEVFNIDIMEIYAIDIKSFSEY